MSEEPKIVSFIEALAKNGLEKSISNFLMKLKMN